MDFNIHMRAKYTGSHAKTTLTEALNEIDRPAALPAQDRAANVNDGRLPFRTSPYSVNWEMTSRAPSTSASEAFILPSASSKTRKPAILLANQSAWARPSA